LVYGLGFRGTGPARVPWPFGCVSWSSVRSWSPPLPSPPSESSRYRSRSPAPPSLRCRPSRRAHPVGASSRFQFRFRFRLRRRPLASQRRQCPRRCPGWTVGASRGRGGGGGGESESDRRVPSARTCATKSNSKIDKCDQVVEKELAIPRGRLSSERMLESQDVHARRHFEASPLPP